MQDFENFLTDKNDDVDNAVYHLILELTGKTEDEFEWDMNVIGDVTLAIEHTLEQHGISICHPYYESSDDEDEDDIPCYKGTDCCHPDCPLKQKVTDNET